MRARETRILRKLQLIIQLTIFINSLLTIINFANIYGQTFFEREYRVQGGRRIKL